MEKPHQTSTASAAEPAHTQRPDRPVLVYDGDCGFCSASARFIERHIPAPGAIVALQLVDLDALGTTRERAEREVLWVDRTGRVRGGAQAIAGLLRAAGGVWAAPGLLLQIPPMRWVAAGVYRWVSANRHRLPGGTPTCALPANSGGPGRPRG